MSILFHLVSYHLHFDSWRLALPRVKPCITITKENKTWEVTLMMLGESLLSPPAYDGEEGEFFFCKTLAYISKVLVGEPEGQKRAHKK